MDLAGKDVIMKVFLSWSGERSKQVAEVLSEWLRCVIQASRPWISTRDVDRGSIWFGEINDQLKDAAAGIVCLTHENKVRPWILFEAGALAKGLSTSRVCTFLVDLESKDVENPLAQFNHTLPTKDGLFNLVKSLNRGLDGAALDERVLAQVFDTYWPQFERNFQSALDRTKPAAPAKPRPKEDVLDEILENTRSLATRLRRVENQIEPSSGTIDLARPNFGPTEVIRRVRDAALQGMPFEAVVERYRNDVPISIIRRVYFDALGRDSSDDKDVSSFA